MTCRRSRSAVAQHPCEFVAARLEQPDDVGFGQGFARDGAVEDVGRPSAVLDPLGSRMARGGRGSPLSLWERARALDRRRGAGAGDPGVGAGKALAVDRAQHRGAQLRHRASAPGPAHRPDRSPAARPAICRPAAVRRARSSRCGQGASGLTWSGVTGDTPPQSLMPAAIMSSSASGIRLGGAWMFIVGAEDQPRHRDRPQMVVEIGLGRIRHAGAGLGPEILDDDFLDVAVALVQGAQREQRLDALGPGLADADQDARGERHRRLAGRGDRRQPHAPAICRASRNAARRARDSRSAALSSMMPCDTETARSRSSLVAAHHAGIEMRQQPGLLQHQRGHLGEIGQRRVVAEPRPALRAPRRSAVRACRRA